MRRKVCLFIVGVGVTVREIGWMIERGGMLMMPRDDPHNMYASNDSIDVDIHMSGDLAEAVDARVRS